MESAIPVTWIPISVRRYLACHLDVAVGANWELLAEHLKIDVLEITWIKNGIVCREGYTSKLLELYSSSITVEQLLSALKAIGNCPAFDKLNEAYPAIKRRYEEEADAARQRTCPFSRSYQSHPISHIELQRQTDDRQVLSLSDVYSRDRANLIQNGAASCGPAIAARNPLPKAVSLQETSGHTSPSSGRQRLPSVLMTYGKDGRMHCLNICRWLQMNKFDVKLIATDDRQFALNTMDSVSVSVNSCFRQVKFVIVLLTPGYLKEIEPAAAEPKCISSKITRLIYELMQIELMDADCKNCRFIPLLTDGIQRADIPLLLRNTRIYSWPKGCKNLYEYMSDKPAL